MNRNISLYLIIIVITSLLLSCERRSVTNSLEQNFAVIDTTVNNVDDSTYIGINDSTQINDSTNNDVRKILIEDLSGKRWDITQAVEKYNFDPTRFQYGLGPDAIKPILNPEMLNYWDEGYPDSNEEFLVIGINLNGDKRAYPLTTMVNYEIADEFIDDAYVAVAYWPLVGLTAVYSREIDGQVLTLSASGWTYDDTFVLYDYETKSIWYHLPRSSGLTCIAGKYIDRKLKEYRSSLTRWSEWIIRNKQSKILKRPTELLIYDPY